MNELPADRDLELGNVEVDGAWPDGDHDLARDIARGK